MKNVTMKNLTDKQYEWLRKEACRVGSTMTGVVKMWLQKNVEDDDKNEMQKEQK